MNIVQHTQGGLFGPLGPPKKCHRGAPEASKMAVSAQKLHFLAIDTTSRLKWVVNLLNKVEHCQTHSGGSVWAFFFVSVTPLGAPKVPWRLQNSPKTVYLALITSDALQWVEQGSKLVEHHRTHQGGYVRPLESATGGCQKHLKMAIFDPKMAYLGQKGPFLTLLGSPKDTSLGPYRPK